MHPYSCFQNTLRQSYKLINWCFWCNQTYTCPTPGYTLPKHRKFLIGDKKLETEVRVTVIQIDKFNSDASCQSLYCNITSALLGTVTCYYNILQLGQVTRSLDSLDSPNEWIVLSMFWKTKLLSAQSLYSVVGIQIKLFKAWLVTLLRLINRIS